MSDHIPFEIQIEIIKRLPIKSLIQFRSVSKPWKSLIDSSRFIANYRVPKSQPQRLLVSYDDLEDSELKCVLIDDNDDTFPERKCSLNAPMSIKLIERPKIIGSSHGLLCLYGYCQDELDSSLSPGFGIIVVWNPSIQKSVVIKVPNRELASPYKTVVGFGVCPNTNDPKLVKIYYIGLIVKDTSCITLQVEVFTLSSRAWRIPSKNLPRKSIGFERYHIVIDGYIYWLAFHGSNADDDFEEYNLIVSFDLTSEEFREMYLPDYLAQTDVDTLSVSKLRDSLVVLKYSENSLKLVYDIWMMEHGVSNSFRKLFTVDVPNASLITVLGFRENGEPVLETDHMYERFASAVVVYEPSSKHIKDLGIYGQTYSFFVSSYMETLMLLDQPDSSIYSNM